MEIKDLIYDTAELRRRYCDIFVLCSKCPLFTDEKSEYGTCCNLERARYTLEDKYEVRLC